MWSMTISAPDRSAKPFEFRLSLTAGSDDEVKTRLKRRWLDMECDHDALLDVVIRKDGAVVFKHQYKRR